MGAYAWGGGVEVEQCLAASCGEGDRMLRLVLRLVRVPTGVLGVCISRLKGHW